MNIDALAGLVHLTELDLNNNPVTDTKPLTNLKKLREVSLQSSKVTNLKPLGGLPALREVRLIGITMLDIPEVSLLQKSLPKANISHNATRTFIRFTNKTEEPIVIRWVNFGGELETYDSGLQPDGTRQQSTYVGHQWVIFAPSGREIGRTFATSLNTDWLVTAKGVQPVPQK